jgi:MerR family Zn(II)-responsive transcriptional regulator of zntA
MYIREVSEKTGLSAHTIRFYEQQGLLNADHTTRAANGYRQYSTAVIERLELIKHGQECGFTLAEIRAVIDIWQAGKLSLTQKAAILREKIAVLKGQITRLEEMRVYLQDELDAIPPDSETDTVPSVPSAARA